MKYLIIFDTTQQNYWSALPDSVGLLNDRPLFVPDFEGGAYACAAIAIRINRLGKCIESRFARRYWQQSAPAIIAMPAAAVEKLKDGEIPPATDLCFDSAVVVGHWVDMETPSFRYNHFDTPVSVNPASINNMIETLSELNTLKTGDILLFVASVPYPVKENDIITAYLPEEDKHYLLRTKIK